MAEAQRTSWWGVGPSFAAVGLILVTPGWLVRIFWPEWFSLPGPYWPWALVGVLLLAGGVGLYVVSVAMLRSAWRKGELLTRGPCAVIRHPIYAAWAWGLLPGAMLLADTWAGLAGCLVAAGLLRLLVIREERRLAERFGQRYNLYRRRTGALAPRLRRPGRARGKGQS